MVEAHTSKAVNEMEDLGILVNILLWAWSSSLVSFTDVIVLSLPFEAFINYLRVRKLKKVHTRLLLDQIL